MMLHEASHAVVGDSFGAIPEIAAAARALDTPVRTLPFVRILPA
jgi:hypothetical protein